MVAIPSTSADALGSQNSAENQEEKDSEIVGTLVRGEVEVFIRRIACRGSHKSRVSCLASVWLSSSTDSVTLSLMAYKKMDMFD